VGKEYTGAQRSQINNHPALFISKKINNYFQVHVHHGREAQGNITMPL
jgi:hypothetical protein